MKEERQWLDTLWYEETPSRVFLRTSPDLGLEVCVGRVGVPVRYTLADLRKVVARAPNNSREVYLGQLLGIYEAALADYIEGRS